VLRVFRIRTSRFKCLCASVRVALIAFILKVSLLDVIRISVETIQNEQQVGVIANEASGTLTCVSHLSSWKIKTKCS
jgi:hypothetical protein